MLGTDMEVPLFEKHDRPVLSVSVLTARIKAALDVEFSSVWVEGELSDVSRPRSGHVYLTLKDGESQIRGVIWRSTANRLPFDPQDGMQVICCGNVDVYAPRGSYQLIIRQMEPKGLGALQMALRQLQQRLAAEGLFAPERKRPLPRFPARIGFVTSPTGAAVRDFVEVLRGRWKGAHVTVIPVRVQGEGAAIEIAQAIGQANRMRPRLDVLVVGRGGGSLEDLWCFNEEIVVRAIHGSEVPVVSAVGHEIDVTLSDLVADARALTPTDAGQLLVPSLEELNAALGNFRHRLSHGLRSRAMTARARLEAAAASVVMRKPFDRIHLLSRSLDEIESRIVRATRNRQTLAHRRLASIASQLESLSPIAVLGRGYSLTTRASDGELIRAASTVAVGDEIRTRFVSGSVVSRVERIESNSH
jgi:exodeoxyribonuclease VII large subunit